jgi:hypothetical protein
MIAPVPRSSAQLPRNAKLAIQRYIAADDTKLHELGSRRLTSDGRVWYPLALTDEVGVLYQAWNQLGEARGAWYDLVRQTCLKASRTHPTGLKPTTTKRFTAMEPWLQTADLELQGVALLAVLDHFGIAVPDATRKLFMAAWVAAGFDR